MKGSPYGLKLCSKVKLVISVLILVFAGKTSFQLPNRN